MDFDLTKEQAAFRKRQGIWLAGEFDPDRILEWDRNQEFPVSTWEESL